MIKALVLVEGRVQGVGYRSLVKRAADSLGVRGFVRNRGDDSVEICCVCESEKQLADFLEAINRKSTSFIGPNVDELTVFRDGTKGFEDYGEFSGFGIRF